MHRQPSPYFLLIFQLIQAPLTINETRKYIPKSAELATAKVRSSATTAFESKLVTIIDAETLIQNLKDAQTEIEQLLCTINGNQHPKSNSIMTPEPEEVNLQNGFALEFIADYEASIIPIFSVKNHPHEYHCLINHITENIQIINAGQAISSYLRAKEFFWLCNHKSHRIDKAVKYLLHRIIKNLQSTSSHDEEIAFKQVQNYKDQIHEKLKKLNRSTPNTENLECGCCFSLGNRTNPFNPRPKYSSPRTFP